MKLLATLCSAAVASAGILPGPLGPIHVPELVAHPNGAVTPADEPAVVAARADHLAAKGAAFHAAVASGPGFVGPAIPAGPIAAPVIARAAPIIAGPRPYVGPLAGVPQLVAHPNGSVTPADEPAVVNARANHLAAKGAAFHAAVASGPGFVGPTIPAGPIVAPVAPVIARTGPVFAQAAPIIAGPRPYVGPLAGVPQLVAHPNGAVTPADTPSVVAARADHLAAKGAAFHAAIASGPGPVVAGPAFAPAPIAPTVHAISPIAPALPYAGPLAGVSALVAHPNGAIVPADEPAVVAARADHLRSKGIPFHG